MTKRGFLGNPKRITKRNSLFTLRRILVRLSCKKLCCGFNVAMLFPSTEHKRKGLAKIESALGMISHFAPHRIERMRRQVKVIWVFTAAPYEAEWQVDLNACVLDHDYVYSEQTSPEQIAATIMHEATHARVQMAGIDYEEKLRARIERLCIRTELWLTKRLPNGSELVKANETKLLLCDELCIAGDFLTDHEFQRREIDSLRDLSRGENWFVRSFINAAAWIISKWQARQLSKRSKTKEASADKEI